MKNPIDKQKISRGYTLLFAVLTAALVLGVAVFILDISRKQYELSVSARDSMYSFYAADAGIECAVGSYGALTVSSTTVSTMSCDGQLSPLTPVSPPQLLSGMQSTSLNQVSGSVPLTYTVNGVSRYQCAIVTFTTGLTTSGQQESVIQSRGYNDCTTSAPIGPDEADPNTVERALSLTKGGAWLW